MEQIIQDSFLKLVRLGVGTSENVTIPNDIVWNDIKALAEKQGLYAVVMDATGKMPVSSRPPKEQLLEWIGEVLQGYEYRYDTYRQTIAEMAAFYNSHGYKMMILKGYACSLDWPKPNHRPCGDIDIWLFGRQEEADATLEAEKPVQVAQRGQEFMVDRSHHHHTVFNWGEFTVENHYDFINVHHHKSHKALEKVFKELGRDDSHSVVVNGEKVYLPSPDLHALFLLKHLSLHFSTGEITLRQVLDWAFFVEKHGKEVDWERIESIYEQFKMRELYGIINAICVEELGFETSIFHYVQFNPALKKRVLNDILSPEFPGEMPNNIFKRVLFKYRRWKANEWKHNLCYNESMWTAFWNGVWNHLLKPSQI